MGVSSDIGQLFLFSCVDLDILIFVVFTYYQAIVDFCSRFDEQCTKLLDFLQNVRSCDAIAHTDNCSFCVTSKGPKIRFIFMELSSNNGCSLGLVEQFSSYTQKSSCGTIKLKFHPFSYCFTRQIHSLSSVHFIHNQV